MRISRILIPFVIMGVSCAVFTSCQEELDYKSSEEESLAKEKLEQKEIILSASFDDNQDATKTSYESSTGHILWSPGDQISLFYGSGSDGGSCFTSTNDEPVQRTQFSGTIGVITGITEDVEDYQFWGVYPYSIQNSCDGSTVTTVVPHEQTGVAETFQDGEFIAIGKSSGLVMGFYNLCGAFYVKVTRNDIIKITLRGKGDEPLAGRVAISMASGTPSVYDVINGENAISLTRSNGVAFTPGVGYFISCLPTRFSEGFYFEMETSGGLFARKEFNIDFTLGRNRFQPFNNTIDNGATFITKVQRNNEIRYTTTDQQALVYPPKGWSYIDPYDSDEDVAASIVSNVYVNGIGIVTYSDNIVSAGLPSGTHEDRARIQTVSLPSTVTTLGSFSGCENLNKVSLLGTLSEQYYNPFTFCPNLESFEGENAFTYMGNWAFLVVNKRAISFAPKGKTYCNLMTSSINAIGKHCFNGSRLESLNLYDIESIGESAFANCSNLQSVLLGAPLSTIANNSFSSCVNLTSVSLPNTLTYIGEYAFVNCPSLSSIDLPTSLKTIREGAFQDSGLTSIIVPANVSSVGDRCFACSSMESATLCAVTPPTLLEDEYPFSGFINPVSYPIYVHKNSLSSYQNDTRWSAYSSRLQAMSIIQFMDPTVKSICIANWDTNHDGELSQSEAEAVTSIGTVFRNTAITTFPELNAFSGLTTISNNAFYSCSQLTEVALPPTIVTIGEGAFAYTSNLKKITLPASLRTIQAQAFLHSDVRELWTLPSGVQTIGNSAFSGCKMSRMVIPNSVTSIGENAFESCTLMTYVSLPSSLSVINRYAFSGSGITSITIPSTVTSIRLLAFSNCSSLSVINCLPSTPPTVEYTSQGLNMFYGISDFTIYVSNTTSYRNAAGWSAYQDKIKYKNF